MTAFFAATLRCPIGLLVQRSVLVFARLQRLNWVHGEKVGELQGRTDRAREWLRLMGGSRGERISKGRTPHGSCGHGRC